MNPILKNILAIVIGWLTGSVINMGLIKLGHLLMPIDGVDPNNMEVMAEVMPTLSFEYFIFPFLAHALGTFIGAFIAARIANYRKMAFAMAIGFLFLLGGIMINYILAGPTWFTVVDLFLAYIPMAWIGGELALKLSKNKK
ncbi:hypothetical protein SAMN04515667_2496 [Formosa sp. Hel1_31_208]|uniref:hypothetical protein n=1 Tax=Formosa sp. Hel1_31_208 TaxID=1798225 RepID=UPI00087DBF77|nr:hypothetical protein [Formosa sp. Hel1_31_208]SDS57991.1 hypothetical protein SAMN04515667_2496 [Formosa sp. Hel1_31_208]